MKGQQINRNIIFPNPEDDIIFSHPDLFKRNGTWSTTTDCRATILYASAIAEVEGYNEGGHTPKINFTDIANGSMFDFGFDDSLEHEFALVQMTGGAIHYFVVEKKHHAGENFYRIIQAFDPEISFNDWMSNTKGGNANLSDAKQNFGGGNFLNQERFDEFKNLAFSENAADKQKAFGLSDKSLPFLKYLTNARVANMANAFGFSRS